MSIKTSQIVSILGELKKVYPANEFAVRNKRDPFRVLISCILSQRTRDENTFKATEQLFSKANTPQQILKMNIETLQSLIKPSGFYRNKSKTIKSVCSSLIKEHKSKVPDTMEELLKFKGVGRKTANIVITFGFNKPAIAVDTHVHRISNRLGIVNTKNPEQTEFALMKITPKEHWIDLNELFVRHGQNTCKPITPYCSICSVQKFCKRVNVKNSR